MSDVLPPPSPQLHPLLRIPVLRSRGGGALMILADVAVVIIAVVWAHQYDWGAVPLGVSLLAFNTNAGLYRSRFTLSILSDLPAVLASYLMATGVTALAAAALNYPEGLAPLFDWAVLFVALVLIRAVVYAAVRWARRKGYLRKTALIVGAGALGARLAKNLLKKPTFGLVPIGFVDEQTSHAPVPAEKLPIPVLGVVSDLVPLMVSTDTDFVLVAYPGMSEEHLVSVVRSADRLSASVAVVPRLYELLSVRSTYDVVSDVPLLRLRRPAFRSPMWGIKRVVDVAFSAFWLIVLSPLLLFIAGLSRIVDGPNVIFRQLRVGIDGRTFEVLKFRSLRPASEEESETNWSIKHDNRVSWFGRLLRKSSLDELPQLFNIFIGDMSFVGPRPERPHFVDIFSQQYPHYGSRARVPCGLTGWAQVNGLRGDTSISDRARFDNFYIENWSLWFDVKIVLLTFTALTKSSG